MLRVMLVGDGESIHVRRLAAALAEIGCEVDLACFEGDPLDGVSLHRIGDLPARSDRRYGIGVLPLARMMARRRPDLVHACFLSSYGLMTNLAVTVLRMRRVDAPSVVQSPLGSDLLVAARRSKIRKRLAALTLRSADLATFNSTTLDGEIRALAPRVARHRFVWGPERSLFGRRLGEEPIAVCTRRLEPIMRVDLVVTAWRRARAIAPERLRRWRLVVTHDGSRREQVAAAAGNDPSIELPGKLAYGELQRLLLRSRLYLSLPESDAASAALLDGLAAGLLPVLNALPGNLEWADESIGEIVERDPSVDEVADAIVRAVSRPFVPTHNRDRVRAVVWEDEVRRLLDAYRSLVQSRNHG